MDDAADARPERAHRFTMYRHLVLYRGGRNRVVPHACLMRASRSTRARARSPGSTRSRVYQPMAAVD